MALNNAALNVKADAFAAAYPFLSLHSAAPDPDTGTNESSADRVAADWPSASGSGDLNVTNKNFTGGASGGPCTHVGFWTLASGGTFGGFKALSGDQVFNAAGEYTVTSLTIDGSST